MYKKLCWQWHHVCERHPFLDHHINKYTVLAQHKHSRIKLTNQSRMHYRKLSISTHTMVLIYENTSGLTFEIMDTKILQGVTLNTVANNERIPEMAYHNTKISSLIYIQLNPIQEISNQTSCRNCICSNILAEWFHIQQWHFKIPQPTQHCNWNRNWLESTLQIRKWII